ncbi:type II toxin-antitoxin system prevent-host-death family antitoxin [Geminocystis sp. CENA526]|uniref:type II toxin-antitoxin system prevent-host-death family antitoxin n=1 Tax=Geminocystis sp. CENA526 TaxID=1355871 RepID=UPI003D6ED354
MKTITPTELKNNINSLLEEVLTTGIPIEINKEGKLLLISPIHKTDKLQKLVYRSQVIQGNPDDLVNIQWKDEVNLDLP